MLQQIDHVQLPVSDLSAAVAWYTTHLGFALGGRHGRAHAVLTLAGGPELYLWETPDATAATFTVRGEPFATVGVRVSGISTLRDRLTAAGARTPVFQDEGYAVVLKFFDPFGNLWVAYEPHATSPVTAG